MNIEPALRRVQMMNLLTATDDEALKFGSTLYRRHFECRNFEHASQQLVADMFHRLTDADGNPIFALVRIFRLSSGEQLPPEENGTRSGYWLTLTGTYGVEPAWCDRQQSVGHRIISPQAFETPMLKATFEQLGIDVRQLEDGQKLRPSTYPVDLERRIANNFYVRHVRVMSAL